MVDVASDQMAMCMKEGATSSSSLLCRLMSSISKLSLQAVA
jgi:hypothetical protein